ncbi:endothelin-1 [Eucyclogobius newberryi]|uniref:endothelin-1 n=1 Tax=Eucyclogobius newberryi TaxID=166745 RepID=UPI003B5A7E51
MDVNFLLSALLATFSLSAAGFSAPAGQARAAAAGHVRTKRCSCATFLDKECVYFCHLDIIWVNTPERVVSYGLGNAPRARRSLRGPRGSGSGPRCRCLQEDDRTCSNFCQHRPDQVLSPKLRAVVQTRTVLEKWRMRRRSRSGSGSGTWDSQSAAA